MKKDDTVRNLSRNQIRPRNHFGTPGHQQKEIAEILERCSYSESFVRTANDLQILDAISGCYEEYKILKKK